MKEPFEHTLSQRHILDSQHCMPQVRLAVLDAGTSIPEAFYTRTQDQAPADKGEETRLEILAHGLLYPSPASDPKSTFAVAPLWSLW